MLVLLWLHGVKWNESWVGNWSLADDHDHDTILLRADHFMRARSSRQATSGIERNVYSKIVLLLARLVRRVWACIAFLE